MKICTDKESLIFQTKKLLKNNFVDSSLKLKSTIHHTLKLKKYMVMMASYLEQEQNVLLISKVLSSFKNYKNKGKSNKFSNKINKL